jgi:hypothetical protein
MSFSGEQAHPFFGPLVGRTTTFLLDGRESNLGFARTMMGLLGEDACAILDLDAFYSSNADAILPSATARSAASSVIRVPGPGAGIEGEFSKIFEARQKVVVIDSLNSLYHLLSQEDGSARSRKLTFAVASLSYFARTNGKAVILSIYRREGFSRSATGRSISSLSDATASVAVNDGELTARIERGTAWPGGRFSSRIP